MRGRLLVCLAVIAATTGPAADACIVAVPRRAMDIRFADVVVVGEVTNYRIVPSLEARRRRREMLANSPNMPPSSRELLERQTSFLGDYGRFDIGVDRALVGHPPAKLTVTWFNSTFRLPDNLARGRYLIALRKPASPTPPLRGPSATIVPDQEPRVLTVLQAPCASPFLMPSDSPQATEVFAAMGLRPLPPEGPPARPGGLSGWAGGPLAALVAAAVVASGALAALAHRRRRRQ